MWAEAVYEIIIPYVGVVMSIIENNYGAIEHTTGKQIHNRRPRASVPFLLHLEKNTSVFASIITAQKRNSLQ